MSGIYLTDNLSIEKLNLQEEKDLKLVKQLEKDELICGEKGYLWTMGYYHNGNDYLQYDDIYNSPFSIYHEESPIGYLEVSKIYEVPRKSSVNLSYALLEEARGHGFMQSVLTIISNDILLDRVHLISEVALMIDSNNIASQKVALRSGFICDCPEENSNFQSLTYLKKRPTIYSTSNSSKMVN